MNHKAPLFMDITNQYKKEKIEKFLKVKNKEISEKQISVDEIIKSIDKERKKLNQNTFEKKNKCAIKNLNLQQRNKYEALICKYRKDPGVYIKYANLEENFEEYYKARSVYERAIDFNYSVDTLWFKYIDFELRNNFLNHARNLFERFIELHPGNEKAWLKYINFEKSKKENENVRRIFKMWINKITNENNYHYYIEFEIKANKIDKARELFEELIMKCKTINNFLKYAQFEIKQKEFKAAEYIFNRILTDFKEKEITAAFYIKFSDFFINLNKKERAVDILKKGNNHLRYSAELIDKTLETTYFEIDNLDNLLLKRKFAILIQNSLEKIFYCKYNEIEIHKYFYIGSFNLKEMLKNCNEEEEKEISCKIYTNLEKLFYNFDFNKFMSSKFEQIHIYSLIDLFLDIANIFEKYEDLKKLEFIYENVICFIIKLGINYSKVFVEYAKYFERANKISESRKIYGKAIGLLPTSEVFENYLEMEKKLKEDDRVRKIYEKYLENDLENGLVWLEFSKWEYKHLVMYRTHSILDLGLKYAEFNRKEIFEFYIEIEKKIDCLKTCKLYEKFCNEFPKEENYFSFFEFLKENQFNTILDKKIFQILFKNLENNSIEFTDILHKFNFTSQERTQFINQKTLLYNEKHSVKPINKISDLLEISKKWKSNND
ncbi:hypothetical protein CWI36_0301p0010 [Hamiltosporidium magnivora]|uniref:Uncharacterized protein n=2 Tax=Hamiltosporidium magnivora TaxID=148818 RepID=A0A4Q9LGU6_9MICR|nr:hypothetical protein CWI36_0301p0010 [Hamiltosporidium magnivora]